ncbi:unnamed protein product [Brugia timori]|uniref:GRAM domain-containing protein n=1 Tax=Brugia timori TaxID=42155 RepID=A0A0R3Q4B2_9BILA|nr:unnamed protein product [Brugia timori]
MKHGQTFFHGDQILFTSNKTIFSGFLHINNRKNGDNNTITIYCGPHIIVAKELSMRVMSFDANVSETLRNTRTVKQLILMKPKPLDFDTT